MTGDAKRFHKKGGKYAGNARCNLEKQINKPVISSENFLGLKDGDKPDELPPDDKGN